MKTHLEAISIYKTKNWVACQFWKENNSIEWAEQQFTFFPTKEEREILNWNHYAEKIIDILNIK